MRPLALIGEVRLALARFGARGWLVAAVAGSATLLMVGVVTAIIENPVFVRMTPVRVQDYAVWLTSALLMGLIAGTFAAPVPAGHAPKAMSGGVLAVLAVGCPTCNKLVVLTLGVSGALTVFEPVQVYVGALSVVLLGWTLRLRVRALTGSCAIPGSRAPTQEREAGSEP